MTGQMLAHRPADAIDPDGFELGGRIQSLKMIAGWAETAEWELPGGAESVADLYARGPAHVPTLARFEAISAIGRITWVASAEELEEALPDDDPKMAVIRAAILEVRAIVRRSSDALREGDPTALGSDSVTMMLEMLDAIDATAKIGQMWWAWDTLPEQSED